MAIAPSSGDFSSFIDITRSISIEFDIGAIDSHQNFAGFRVVAMEEVGSSTLKAGTAQVRPRFLWSSDEHSSALSR